MSQISNYFNTGVIPPGTFVKTLTGNSGGAVGPDGSSNINILGSGVISIAGNPGTNTLTVSASGTISNSFPTDSGTATPVAGVLDIFGDTHNITTTGAGNVVTIKLTGITQHSLQVGGASNALTQLGVATNGQLPIGSTGADPVLATLTAGTGISITNGAGSITIASGSAVAESFPTDSGTATPSAGILNIDGDTHNITTTGSGNTVNVKLTGITQHSIQVGGASNALTQLGVATNGQLPIGSTGADPVLAVLTAGTGITVTNGAGSITLATASGVATSFPTDSGTATPSSGVLNIDGDTHNVTTTGSGNTVNVKLTGITQHSLQVGGASNALTQLGVATNGQLPIGSTGADPVLATLTAGTNISITNGAGSITINAAGAAGLTWSVITANQTAAVDNGYFCNKAGTLALALPSVSSVGDVIEVTNENTALGVQLTQAAGQQILIGNTNTTLGATGTLTSSAVGDTLKIVCYTANTIWRTTSLVGNWSVV